MELVPTRYLFDFEIPLRYRAKSPKLTGRLADWSNEFLLPPLCRLDGVEPFAPVYACWNEAGLFVATRVTGKTKPLRCDPSHYWKSDALRICTDMRDARANRRASRYCQQFFIMPAGGGANGDQPSAGTAKLTRAREHARPTDPTAIEVAAQTSAGEYALEAHLSGSALAGFDPDEHTRIGFYYILEDRDHGQQYLTIGDDLYWYVDPSTWATAVLVR